MSTDRDTTRVVRSWLQTDEHESADRVLDAVLDRLDATPQRRATWWPARRIPTMNKFVAYAIAAAAVVVVVLVGAQLFGRSNVGAPAPTETASPSPSPVVNGALPAADAIPEGSYVIADPFRVEMGLQIGPGWSMWGGPFDSQVGAIYEGSPDDHGIIFVIVNNVYSDACDPGAGAMTPQLGPTVDDLAAALATQAGTESSDPVPVTIDGHDGLYLDYTYPGGECAHLTRWPTSAGDRLALTGERDQVWILDVDGTRLVLDAFSFPGTTDEDLAEMREMIENLDLPPLAGG
jgi:hypothetical protein